MAEPTFWPNRHPGGLPAVARGPDRGRRQPAAALAGVWIGFDRLLRAPILRALPTPAPRREGVGRVDCWWKFDRVLTAHFASPIKATPKDYADAFAYLSGPTADPPIQCKDWALLDGLNDLIDTNTLGAPVKYDFKAGCPQ